MMLAFYDQMYDRENVYFQSHKYLFIINDQYY